MPVDRTFNTISVGLFDGEMSNDATLIAAVLIGQCKNRYGLFRTPKKFLLRLFNHLDSEQIDSALQELEDEMYIRQFLDEHGKDNIWILQHFKSDYAQTRYKVKNLDALYKVIRACPVEIAQRFIECYPDYFNHDFLDATFDKLLNKSRVPARNETHDDILSVLRDVLRDVNRDVVPHVVREAIPASASVSVSESEGESEGGNGRIKKPVKPARKKSAPSGTWKKQRLLVQKLFPKLHVQEIETEARALDKILQMDNAPDNLLDAIRWASLLDASDTEYSMFKIASFKTLNQVMPNGFKRCINIHTAYLRSMNGANTEVARDAFGEPIPDCTVRKIKKAVKKRSGAVDSSTRKLTDVLTKKKVTRQVSRKMTDDTVQDRKQPPSGNCRKYENVIAQLFPRADRRSIPQGAKILDEIFRLDNPPETFMDALRWASRLKQDDKKHSNLCVRDCGKLRHIISPGNEKLWEKIHAAFLKTLVTNG